MEEAGFRWRKFHTMQWGNAASREAYWFSVTNVSDADLESVVRRAEQLATERLYNKGLAWVQVSRSDWAQARREWTYG